MNEKHNSIWNEIALTHTSRPAQEIPCPWAKISFRFLTHTQKETMSVDLPPTLFLSFFHFPYVSLDQICVYRGPSFSMTHNTVFTIWDEQNKIFIKAEEVMSFLFVQQPQSKQKFKLPVKPFNIPRIIQKNLYKSILRGSRAIALEVETL